jgi:hypothetical protein
MSNDIQLMEIGLGGERLDLGSDACRRFSDVGVVDQAERVRDHHVAQSGQVAIEEVQGAARGQVAVDEQDWAPARDWPAGVGGADPVSSQGVPDEGRSSPRILDPAVEDGGL